MKEIQIPYGHTTLPLHLEEARTAAVLTAKMHAYVPEKSEPELIREALEHPIGSMRLCDLARGKQNVVLVTSDHTRAVPSRLTLPLLLAEIRAGIPPPTSPFSSPPACTGPPRRKSSAGCLAMRLWTGKTLR